VLTYDAYSETIEEKQRDMRTIRDEIKEEVKKQLAPLITQIKPEILKQWLV
jgi:F0F1-type ATP synthase membrane subunit b/b'